MAEHAVVIAGAGPTGLMLAGELALAGIDVVIVEPRADQLIDGSRALGQNARTLEVLDQRGIVDRFLAAGEPMQIHSFAGTPLDISDLPTRHAYGLSLAQNLFEPILADWVAELQVPILRQRHVTGLAQDEDGVEVELSDGGGLRARCVVGCDGGRSVVRRAAGIDFAGREASISWINGEVEMAEPVAFGLRGGGGVGPGAAAGLVRVVLREAEVRSGEPTVEDLRAALVAVDGTDHGVHSPRWISRFTDMTRQAATYRQGRVLVAGDAAHVHPPQGGQGLNTGVQDAVNLGWKLAQVVTGASPESLLDTYHAERHPVGARAMRNALAILAVGELDDHHQALRDSLATVLTLDDARRTIGANLAGLDLRYDLGDGHPLVGRRMPDLDLMTSAGPTRAFTLLHDGRSVFLDLGGPGAVDLPPWSARVRQVAASYQGPWEVPALGVVPAPAAVLVRPDGYVAWAGEPHDPALPAALTAWCGAPS